MGQQGSHRDAAHSWYAAQQPGLFRPQRRTPNRLLQGGIEFGQLFAQPAHVRGNAPIKAWSGAAVPIALGREHFDNLPAAGDQCHQFPALGVGQGPGIRLDQFCEMGQDAGIDRVGLGQPAGGTRKVAHLARLTTAIGKPTAANSWRPRFHNRHWLRAPCGSRSTSSVA